MKVLVATRQTQGEREDDFSDTVEGELVFDAGRCADAAKLPMWHCACAIGFSGVASGELTTTAMVADLPLGLAEYERAVRDGTREWCCTSCARTYAHGARMLALKFPVGTVLERFQEDIRPRVSFPSSFHPRPSSPEHD